MDLFLAMNSIIKEEGPLKHPNVSADTFGSMSEGHQNKM